MSQLQRDHERLLLIICLIFLIVKSSEANDEERTEVGYPRWVAKFEYFLLDFSNEKSWQEVVQLCKEFGGETAELTVKSDLSGILSTLMINNRTSCYTAFCYSHNGHWWQSTCDGTVLEPSDLGQTLDPSKGQCMSLSLTDLSTDLTRPSQGHLFSTSNGDNFLSILSSQGCLKPEYTHAICKHKKTNHETCDDNPCGPAASCIPICVSDGAESFMCHCPSGMTGPTCGQDVNECITGTHNCTNDLNCINIVGGFECAKSNSSNNISTDKPTTLSNGISSKESNYTVVGDKTTSSPANNVTQGKEPDNGYYIIAIIGSVFFVAAIAVVCCIICRCMYKKAKKSYEPIQHQEDQTL